MILAISLLLLPLLLCCSLPSLAQAPPNAPATRADQARKDNAETAAKDNTQTLDKRAQNPSPQTTTRERSGSGDEKTSSETTSGETTGGATDRDATNSHSDETQAVSPQEQRPPANLFRTEKKDEVADGLPLIVGGEEIMRFKATISGFTPAQRVAAIDERIAKMIRKPDFNPLAVGLTDTGFSTDVLCGDAIIMTVTDRDASLIGFKDRKKLAEDCAEKLVRALRAEQLARSPKEIFFALAQTAGTTVVLIFALLLMAAIFPRVYSQIANLRGQYIRSLKIQNAELLSEESLTDVVIGVCRVVRGAVTLLLILIYIERVLSYFPTTRRLSTQIVEQTVLPAVAAIASAVTSYFPNLLLIVLISVSTYYLITFTHFLFHEISRGRITVSDFDPEWADPTYKIARFMIIAFALVLIFPYLPGSGSPAFQQISIFLGVLFSLGSSGAVSNIVAGIFLTYTGAFRLGDRVKISDTVGDVVERKLLYTRIRSIKDEYITVPNSMVLGAHIINYSSSIKRSGLILHTSVTIGYDVSWQQVQDLLLGAALGTEGVLSEPPPFVLITSLDDFYVTHEINCYTASPDLMAVIYGALHRSILTKFQEAGVEIMSPHYTAIRRGNEKAIPPKGR